MIESLLNRKVEKRPSQVQLNGRILFLAEDPSLVRSQLDGDDLDITNIPPLLDAWRVCVHRLEVRR